MSAYRRGAALQLGPNRPAAAVGGFVQWPSDALDALNTARNEINTLNTDILASAVPTNFKDAWVSFYKEFRDWVQEREGFFGRAFNSAAVTEKANEYRGRGVDWRKRFETLGGKTSAPPPRIEASKGIEVDWGAIKWIAGGLAALYVYKEFVKPAMSEGKEIVRFARGK